MNKAIELLSKERCFLEAPAGCGKTHTIAEAVAQQEEGVQLVLTHTHAGVQSLLQKINRYRVPRSKYQLDTIAGWSLRLAKCYPKTASFLKRFPDTSADYNQIYRGARELLTFPFMQRVICLSYAGVIVDEYQDCTLLQHNLVLALAELIPCRILGDPLQGIFRFGHQSHFLNWDEHVTRNFEEIPMLDHPFRWADKNMPLGRWLLEIRDDIKEGNALDLSAPVIQHVPLSSQSRYDQYLKQVTRVCRQVANRNGTVAAIHPRNESAKPCHELAKRLSGIYQSVEENDAKQLQEWAGRIEAARGNARVICLIDFASECSTEISSAFKTIRRKFESNEEPTFSTRMHHKEIAQFLLTVSKSDDFRSLHTALKIINDSVSEAKTYRRDLWNAMLSTLQSYDPNAHESLADAAWQARQRQRHTGRPEFSRIVARTLLIKGLEFDHAILLEANKFDSHNLYVALTRASKSVTVISPAPVLTPHINNS